MNIVGIDPGLKTGVAVWDLYKVTCTATIGSLKEVISFLDTIEPAVIHMEDYLPRAGVTRQTEAPDIIGAVKSWGKTHECDVYTRSSAIKTWSTNNKLTAVGWKGRGPHERDALRHLLFGLCNSRSGRQMCGGQGLLEKIVDSLDL